MHIAQWWPELQPTSREWLTEHNGEPLPAEVVDDIASAGGARAKRLTDDEVDWIEATANGETP